MNNENKKLSRNIKTRIEAKIKIDGNMKLILNKIKTEQKRKKHLDKIKELKIELVEMKHAKNPDKLKSALKELNKHQVVDENLHEIKQEILEDYGGGFEMVASLKVGDQIRQTHIRFRNITDYEACINSIDEGYDAEDSIFNSCFFKMITPQFNRKTEINMEMVVILNMKLLKIDVIIVLNRLKTKGHCFVKCSNFITGEYYKQQYLDSIRNEKRRSNIMSKARIQPFCRANSNKLGYFDGIRVFLRSVTDRNNALFLYNTHFCLI